MTGHLDIFRFITLGFARSLRLFNLLSISVIVSEMALVKRSGGKGRLVSDLAADDPQRGQKLDPVRVEFLRLNSSVDQGSDSVVHKQVGVDLLGDHVR